MRGVALCRHSSAKLANGLLKYARLPSRDVRVALSLFVPVLVLLLWTLIYLAASLTSAVIVLLSGVMVVALDRSESLTL